MKPVFLKSAERLGAGLSSVLLLTGLLLCPFVAEGTDSTATFTGSITTPPQVDATNFNNLAVWNISTASRYETAHTLNYTNVGQMTGTVGWEFDYGPLSNGGRGWSANFINNSGGATITANDSFIQNPQSFLALASYLWISATNVVNKGTLVAGGSGEMKLTGGGMDLSRSGLEILPLVGTGGIITSSNFVPDIGIYDEYWALTNMNFDSSLIWNGVNAASPPSFGVVEPCVVVVGTNLAPVVNIPSFTPTVADSTNVFTGFLAVTITNADSSTTVIDIATNVVYQAVFVNVPNPSITGNIRFTPSLISSNRFFTVAVQFSSESTNVVTRLAQTSTIYLVDNLASSTNRALLLNSSVNPGAACSAPTFRPANYVVSRIDPGAFAAGNPGSGTPPSNFLFDPSWSNQVVSATYSGYSAFIDNLATQIAVGGSITNVPGRIRISANNLDLSRTRMRGESEIVIQASNLVGSAGAVVDCQNLSYNLGSTNGYLDITNLVLPLVNRLNGTIDCWSALWTNGTTVVLPGFSISSNVPTPIFLTNSVIVNLAVTIVDASGLLTEAPVTVDDLILHGTNIVLSDSANVSSTFLLDGRSFTLLGDLTLGNQLQNWTYFFAPTLRYFTNNGEIDIPDDAHFGDDGPTNYAAFVNDGLIFSSGQTINSDYLKINGGGDIAFGGNFSATCETGLVANAFIYAGGGDIQFAANSLLIDPSELDSANAIDFSVTNSLSDAGFGTGNIFICQNGFNLLVKPATGDLLGTTIDDVALWDSEVDHLWAGHDFGAVATGYTNNVSVGTLILDQNNPLFEPLYHFTGASANNGLYVSNLDLSLLVATNYPDQIEIDPNITVYFASVTLDTNNVVTATPEQYVTNQFNGRLMWVSGVTSLVKKSGISGVSASPGGGGFKLSISSAAGQTNIIQASTNLATWIPIYTNIGSTTFTDLNAQSYPRRFYRVKTLQ